MRSRFLFCVALASTGLFVVGVARTAGAADPKASGKSGKKPAGDSLSDDKVIGKQLQWEDKVMGPDDKRGELDKILKAQAINKAATEKAEREKEKAAKENAAREAKEAAAPKPQQKKGGEVALPSLPDEGAPSGKGKSGKSVEISPKLDTAAAAAPPPPSKPADDKFIDKLLKEEGSSKKKKASASADDKDLLDILATEKAAKPAPKGKGKGKSDGVDSLLQEADKEPAMPTPKIKHETPEWAKPEIQSTPAAAPVVVRPQPKRDDGIIHVVQGAATPAGRPAPASVPTRAASTAMVPASRRPPAAAPAPARGGGWNDPFADAPRKTVASRNTRTVDDDDDVAPPPPRRNASQAPAPAKPTRAAARSTRASDDDSWDDPFEAKKAASSRRAPEPVAKPVKNTPPARGGAWKDPFTEDAPPKSGRGTPTRGTVAMRDSSHDSAKDEGPNKWEAAAKHGAAAPSDDSASGDAAGQTRGRWGVLKKRAH